MNSNDIQLNLKDVLNDIPQGVNLVAVSKFHPIESLQAAYDAGQRIFGESHALEMTEKHEKLPQDIQWHFIGHLQTNKIKYIIPYVSLIHAVDSLKLLQEINKHAIKCGRQDRVKCLLELHVARESTKYGFTPEECLELLQNKEWKELDHIQLAGIMGMASNTDDMNTVRNEFRVLSEFFHEAKRRFFEDDPEFKELSMGMSHDFKIAIEEGSTMVRVGSKIFGNREY